MSATAVEPKPLTEKTRDVMDAILISKEKATVPVVAEYMGVSMQTVTGALSTLKKRGYVTVEDGILVPTAEANFEFGSGTPAEAPAAKTPTAEDEVNGDDEANDEIKAAGNVVIEGDGDEVVSITPIAAAVATDAPVIVAGTVEELVHETPAADPVKADVIEPVPAVVETPAAPAVVSGPNKTALAKPIFEKMKDGPRKDLMAALQAPVSEGGAGLSKNGANTYIYNLRKAAGMVTPRTAVAAAVEALPADAPKEEVAAVVEAVLENTADTPEEGLGLAIEAADTDPVEPEAEAEKPAD